MSETIKKVEVTYLSDSVKNVKDAFGVHSKIAEALEQKILDSDLSDTSLTIGLFGEWGTGKSVIIDKLSDRIHTRDDISFINIDVWKYNGIPLLRYVLYEVAKQGPTTKFLPKDKDKLAKDTEVAIQIGTSLEKYKNPICKKIEKWLPLVKGIASLLAFSTLLLNALPNASNWLTILLSQISVPTAILAWCGDWVNKEVFKSLKSWFASVSESIIVLDKTIVPTISPEQFEKEFDVILLSLQKKGIKKHVIIFDNIDRCKGDFAYEVLSTIKTYLCKENCVYIVPCDDVAIKHYLTNEYKHADDNRPFHRDFATEFLDKLFNTYFRIPLVSEDSRDKYIEECLSHTVFANSIHKSKIVSTLYYAYKGETPRQIKKYINDLISYYEIAAKVDVKKDFLLDDIWTFAVMVAVKQIAPDFEKELVENPDLIHKIEHVGITHLQKQKVKELFLKLRYQFPQDKSVLTYVFFVKADDEVLLSNATREGEIFELDEKNAAVVAKLLRNDKDYEIFLQNDFNSIIASIIKYGASSFIEQKAITKNFDFLFYALKDSVSYTNSTKIILDCLENQGNNSDSIADTFRLIGDFIANEDDKYALFEGFNTAFNYVTLYNFILKNPIINFDIQINQFIEKLAKDKNLTLTDELYSLVCGVSSQQKYDYFSDAFLEKISPLITYKDVKWRAWEFDTISKSKSKLLFLKTITLTSKLATTITEVGITMSTNKDNAFEEIEYLNSFNDLPVSVLTQMSKNDPTKEAFTCFSTILIVLSELQEQAQVSFSLATKMYGISFLETHFTTPAIAYKNKVKYISSVCDDEELLDIIANSNNVFETLISEKTILDAILTNSSQTWKLNNMRRFISFPLNLNFAAPFVLSSEWSRKDKVKIHKLISEVCVRSANEYADINILTINQVLLIISFALDVVENKETLDASMSVFKKVADENFTAGLSVYKVFSEKNYQQAVFFDYLLNNIIKKFPITTSEIPEHVFVINEIEMHKEQIGNEKLLNIIDSCIEVANKKSVILIGLKALEIYSNKDLSILDKYKVKLETIRNGSTLTAEIDKLFDKLSEKSPNT